MSGGMRQSALRIQCRLCTRIGHDAKANTLELEGHRENEVRHQHRHLEWNELIHTQPSRAERLLATHSTRLNDNQSRGGN